VLGQPDRPGGEPELMVDEICDFLLLAGRWRIGRAAIYRLFV